MQGQVRIRIKFKNKNAKYKIKNKYKYFRAEHSNGRIIGENTRTRIMASPGDHSMNEWRVLYTLHHRMPNGGQNDFRKMGWYRIV